MSKNTHYRRYAVARRPPAPYRSALEAEFALLLQAKLQSGEITWWQYEPVTLRLGPRCTYTPDFLAVGADGTLTFYEVKGRPREDAAVKLKTAAERYWMFRFMLCRKNGKHWEMSEI